MTVLPFTKMQGVGNDFVVVDGRHEQRDWARLSPKLCHRKLGVGADGVLVLCESDCADVRMRMFNPDGSEDVCGNGLRCIARYAVEHGIAGDNMWIETKAGSRRATVMRDGSGAVRAITVGMGSPQFETRHIPMYGANGPVIGYPLELDGGERLLITALSTGSTHAVTFVDDLPDDATFLRISPLVENHRQFPERTSLMWCRAEGSRVQMRIWERGAGETWGCGTGACAAAVAAVVNAVVPEYEPVTVTSRGGTLVVTWSPEGEIAMHGPAETTFVAQISLPAAYDSGSVRGVGGI